MRWLTLFALAVLLGLASCTAEENPALMAQELERWRGTWRCVERNEEGKPVPLEEVNKIKLTVGGTLYHFEWGEEFHEFGRYKFYPSREPKEMDITIESPPDMAGREIRLIYKIEGDQLTLAHREDGQRPKDFTAEPDSGQTKETWKKVKP
jgi:uncharacterized protein (TIGR03067 family)